MSFILKFYFRIERGFTNIKLKVDVCVCVYIYIYNFVNALLSMASNK